MMKNIFNNLLLKLLPARLNSFFKKADFIWLIHPLETKDITSRYRFLKLVPTGMMIRLLNLLPPLILAPITGLKDVEGKDFNGYLIGCFLLPDQIRRDQPLVKRKIYSAAKISSKLDSRILGIGGIIVVDAEFEKKVKKNYHVVLANGTATACVIMHARIERILLKNNKKFNDLSLAIINSTSLKGRLLSRFWSNFAFKEILLLGRNFDHLNKLRRETNRSDIKISTQIQDIRKYDLVIVAPSYNRIDFQVDYFRDDMIIYDINDPKYDFNEIIETYSNIQIYSNGLINTQDVNYHYDLGIPSNCSQVCLTETFLLARVREARQSYFNEVALNQVHQIQETFFNSNFFLID